MTPGVFHRYISKRAWIRAQAKLVEARIAYKAYRERSGKYVIEEGYQTRMDR